MNTALITGAGRGIGLATAHASVAAGWRVLALDKQFGPEIAGERVEFDLRNSEAIPSLIQELGEIHTLVNNAAVLYCDPFDAIPEEHRREILAVNLEGPAALAPHGNSAKHWKAGYNWYVPCGRQVRRRSNPVATRSSWRRGPPCSLVRTTLQTPLRDRASTQRLP